MKRVLVIGIAVIILAVAVLYYPATPSQPKPTVTFHTSPPVEVTVEIADSPQERQQGLMFRESLGPQDGMLFVFDEPQVLGFWMKNTLIPLDIIFIDADLVVVNIQEAVPCEADPCPSYPSSGEAQYVVEVKQGFAAARGIQPGTTIQLPDRGY